MAAIVACTEPVVTGAAVSATIFLLWRAGSLPRRTCETERQKGMKKNCSESTQDAASDDDSHHSRGSFSFHHE